MNKNAALEEIDGIKSCHSFGEVNGRLEKILEYIDYYDPPTNLSENENFVELEKYIQDLQLVTTIFPFAKNVQDFTENISETNTDLMIYLENFVYDDTEYSSVVEYISSEFDNLDEFCLHFAKTYFSHNFQEFIRKL